MGTRASLRVFLFCFVLFCLFVCLFVCFLSLKQRAIGVFVNRDCKSLTTEQALRPVYQHNGQALWPGDWH